MLEQVIQWSLQVVYLYLHSDAACVKGSQHCRQLSKALQLASLHTYTIGPLQKLRPGSIFVTSDPRGTKWTGTVWKETHTGYG